MSIQAKNTNSESIPYDFRVGTGSDVVNLLLVPQIFFTSFDSKTLGIATGASSFEGAARFTRGMQLLYQAYRLKDRFGAVEGFREIIGGGLQFLGGTAYLGIHFLALGALMGQATANAKAIPQWKIVGNALYILGMITMAIANGWLLAKTITFCNENTEKDNLAKWFESISKKTPKDLASLTNAACAASVTSAKELGLLERLNSPDTNVKKAAEKEAGALKVQITEASQALLSRLIFFVVMVLLLSAVFATLTIAHLPLAGIIALSAILILLSMVMTSIDLHNLRKSDTPLASGDTTYHVAMILLVLIPLIISSAVTLGCGFALLPLFYSLILGITSTAVPVFSLAKLKANEKRFMENYNESHPDLKRLETELRKSKTIDLKGSKDEGKFVDLRIQRLFKGLSQKDKQKIKDIYVKKYSNWIQSCEDKNIDLFDQRLIPIEQALKHVAKNYWKEKQIDKAMSLQKALDNLRSRKLNLSSGDLREELFKEWAYLNFRFKDESELVEVVRNAQKEDASLSV